MNCLISLGALSRLAFLLVAAMLCSCREISEPPRIDRTESGVEGFASVLKIRRGRRSDCLNSGTSVLFALMCKKAFTL